MKRTPLKRTKPINLKSARRQREDRTYAEKRTAFLVSNPTCARCRGRATEVQHLLGRVGPAYLDESTWLAMCRGCHAWAHANPAEAYAQGYLRRRNEVH